MQIEALKVFCDLTEAESFTKAAKINGVTQSAVSQQVSALERIFKCILIERSKKRFRLTREGEVLYEYSKQIIQTYESLSNRLLEIRNIVSGTIRVSTIYSVGLHDLPPHLQKYLKQYPTVKVHVEYRRANQVYDDVLGNTVDIGLIAFANKDPRLEFIPLREDRMVLICSPNHDFAGSKSLKIAELAGQKFVGFEPDVPTQRAIDRVFKDNAITVQTVMEFDNIETVKRAVEIDAGISIVPEETIGAERIRKSLVAIPIQDVEFVRPLSAIVKKNKVISPAMKQFIAMIQKGKG